MTNSTSGIPTTTITSILMTIITDRCVWHTHTHTHTHAHAHAHAHTHTHTQHTHTTHTHTQRLKDLKQWEAGRKFGGHREEEERQKRKAAYEVAVEKVYMLKRCECVCEREREREGREGGRGGEGGREGGRERGRELILYSRHRQSRRKTAPGFKPIGANSTTTYHRSTPEVNPSPQQGLYNSSLEHKGLKH